MKIRLDMDESQRQMILMALAHLSIERPGWDDALNRIALQIDNPIGGRLRGEMYDEFRTLKRRHEVAEKQECCDHKFVDSKSCLKCGWTPNAQD